MKKILILLSVIILNLESYCQIKNGYRELKIGDAAPELAYQSPNGTIVKLSSLKGKVVLIDFWASWCKPCRAENSNLVHTYLKFKETEFINGNGFSIYSISLDDNKNKWIEAIENDNLMWYSHVSDLKGGNSEPAAIYNIKVVPYNFLIDGKGVIIAINLRGKELEKTLETYSK